MTTQEFINSIFQELKGSEHPKAFEATLILDGQPPSIGLFAPEKNERGEGQFQPTGGNSPNIDLSNQGVLKVSSRTEQLRVTNCRRCPHHEKSNHFHLHFEVME
jgi:hypothetical protein